MSSNEVGVAIVGAGFISDYHLKGLQYAGANIKAICDLDIERAAEKADRYRIPEALPDYQTLLDRDDINAFIVATPDKTHEAITIDLLTSKKSVMVQKPMAPTPGACRRMIAVAKQYNVLLCVSWMHRHFEEVRKMRDILHQGMLGPVYSVRQRNAIPGADSDPWFYNKEAVGGGAVLQLGIHGIDLLRHLFGPIKAVLSHTKLVKTERKLADGLIVFPDNEDLAYIMYQFESGAQAIQEVITHELAGTDRFRLEIYGEKGTAWLRSERGALSIYLPDRMGTGGWFEPDLPERPFGEVQHRKFIDMVRGHIPPDTSAYDGLAAALTVEAIYYSAEHGNWEEVPSV